MPERLYLSSRAIIGRMYQKYEELLGAGFATKLGMKFTSDQESETYRWLGMTPPMREWIGGRQAKGLRSNPYTVTNADYEATLEVQRKDLRRDKTGQLFARIDELAARAAGHWDKLVHDAIIAGESTNCYDAQYMFDIDHSEGDSGTQLNLLATAQVTPLNVGTAAAPTESEMIDAILGVIAYMLSYKDDNGEPMHGDAKNWMIMCPYNLWGAAVACATSHTLGAASGAVRDNVMLRSGFNLDVVMNSRLTTTTVFYVFRTDGPAAPFILQEEEGLKVAAKAEGSEYEFDTRMHQYGVSATRAVGYGYWQYGAHCTLS